MLFRSPGVTQRTVHVDQHLAVFAGETFYQADWDKADEKGTVLQVVRNPTWLTPYFACVMVAAGMLLQFTTHLVRFAAKRKTV